MSCKKNKKAFRLVTLSGTPHLAPRGKAKADSFRRSAKLRGFCAISYKLKKAADELHRQQCSCLIIKNDTVIYKSHEKGVYPLLCSVDLMKGAILADKTIGKAAALLCVLGRAEGVYGRIMSKPAEQVLKQHKIKYKFGTETDNILNRPQTDICPMERSWKKLIRPKRPFIFSRKLCKKQANKLPEEISYDLQEVRKHGI